MNSKVTFRLK